MSPHDVIVKILHETEGLGEREFRALVDYLDGVRPTDNTADVLAEVATCERCHIAIRNTTTGIIVGRCAFCGGAMLATEGAWQATPARTP